MDNGCPQRLIKVAQIIYLGTKIITDEEESEKMKCGLNKSGNDKMLRGVSDILIMSVWAIF